MQHDKDIKKKQFPPGEGLLKVHPKLARALKSSTYLYWPNCMMSHGHRVDKEVTHIECLSVETRHLAVKDRVYVLSVTWSDGLITQPEVQHSSLIELRTRLKNECYRGMKDVDIPDIPTLGLSLLEFPGAGKRRKAIQEFCQQILKLPHAPEKTRIINEFFPRIDDSQNRSSSVFYADILTVREQHQSASGNHSTNSQSQGDKAIHYAEFSSPAFSIGQDVPDGYAEIVMQYPQPPTRTADETVHYAELEVPANSSSNNTSRKPALVAATNKRPARPAPDPEPLYTEVIRQVSPPARLVQQSPEQETCSDFSSRNHEPAQLASATDEVDGGDTSESAPPLYMNMAAEQTERPYANFIHGKKTGRKTESTSSGVIRYCKVLQSYMPNTSHSQGLAVEAGDVVQVQLESGGRAYCLLCSKYPSVITRPMEGWLPVNILKTCQPNFVEDANSQVPVYKSDDFVEHSSSAQSSSTGAKDKKRGKIAKLAQQTLQLKISNKLNEKTPSIDTESDDLISDMSILMNSTQSHHQPDMISPIPTIPDVLSPSLKMPAGKILFESLERQGSHSSSKTKPSSHIVADSDQSMTVLRVVAVADYKPTATEASGALLSFTRGDLADLTYCSENRWWCVIIGQRYGWVPADYWRILADDGRIGSGDTAPWMVGALSRSECEQNLMKYGNQRDFVVRQSKNLAGQYALSIKYNNRARHFPIVTTEDGKFYIGKHRFATLENVIIYYMKNTLFEDETSGVSVILGSPLKAV